MIKQLRTTGIIAALVMILSIIPVKDRWVDQAKLWVGFTLLCFQLKLLWDELEDDGVSNDHTYVIKEARRAYYQQNPDMFGQAVPMEFIKQFARQLYSPTVVKQPTTTYRAPERPSTIKPSPTPSAAHPQWLKNAVEYPSVLVFGAPGSGKTHFASALVDLKIKTGHEVVVLDPHDQPGKWPFCEVVGGGLDYSAIDKAILELKKEIKDRYEQYAQGVKTFPSKTYVCEELTLWASHCQYAGRLIEVIPDGRKIGIGLFMIAHNNTMSAVGGSNGMSAMFKSSVYQIKLLVQMDASGKACPAFKAKVNSCDTGWVDEVVPHLELPIVVQSQPVEEPKALPTVVEPDELLHDPQLLDLLKQNQDLKMVAELASKNNGTISLVQIIAQCQNDDRRFLNGVDLAFDVNYLKSRLEFLAEHYSQTFDWDGQRLKLKSPVLVAHLQLNNLKV